jgi:hypothetical protein
VLRKRFFRIVSRLHCRPKVIHAKKRTSHAGCNACDARFRRVFHRICYSNVAHLNRVSCVQHLRGMCAGCCSGSMWHTRVCHTRGMRTSDALVARVSFMYCRCRALLARRQCAGPWVTFSQYCASKYSPPISCGGQRELSLVRHSTPLRHLGIKERARIRHFVTRDWISFRRELIFSSDLKAQSSPFPCCERKARYSTSVLLVTNKYYWLNWCCGPS